MSTDVNGPRFVQQSVTVVLKQQIRLDEPALDGVRVSEDADRLPLQRRSIARRRQRAFLIDEAHVVGARGLPTWHALRQSLTGFTAQSAQVDAIERAAGPHPLREQTDAQHGSPE